MEAIEFDVIREGLGRAPLNMNINHLCR